MWEILEQTSDFIGIIGVLLTLIAYYLISVNRLSATNLVYVLFNLLGSIMLMYSLLFHWNLSSVLIEVAWITISLIGLYRALKVRV